jgi:drug/metabolite transporter (DMT)-like permease
MKLGNGGLGLPLALLTAGTFSMSGSLADALIEAGWSPAAAVTARVTVAALILTPPALVTLRGRWRLLREAASTIAAFGLVAVAACQFAFFSAVSRLPVGVALLLEYLGILLVVVWLWVRHGQRPRRLTVGGALAAMIGLVLVLDIVGQHHLDPIGVLWGLSAAVGLAVFYTLSARTDQLLPPVALAWAAMTLGAIALAISGLLGMTPMHASTADVQLASYHVHWWVAVLSLAVVAAALPYVTGIAAARLLGAKLSSFVGLSEVLFAVLFAWLLLGQLPGVLQLIGGVFVVGGVVLVRIDELRTPDSSNREPVDSLTV